MRKIKCFIKEESASCPGKYIIKPIYDNFYLESTKGSFNVIGARLMGVDYAQFLRMCRDCFGAEIIGKNSLYPFAVFEDTKELQALIDNLNARASFVLWERAHPEFEAHRSTVEEARNESN